MRNPVDVAQRIVSQSRARTGSPRVIAIPTQKGGTAKTTTCGNLGAGLAKITGGRVLLVDADPQHNLTTWLGSDPPPAGRLRDVLEDPAAIRSAIGRSVAEGCDLLYGSLDTAEAQELLAQWTDRPYLALSEALAGVLAADYRFVLIDCPPGLGLLSINAIVAATEVLAPVLAQPMSLPGLGQLRDTIGELTEGGLLERSPAIRILVTQYHGMDGRAAELDGELRREFPQEMLATRIRYAPLTAHVFGLSQTVLQYAPDSAGAIDYLALAAELVNA